MWQIRWLDLERTKGEIWRVKDFWRLPKAPVKEGTITVQRTPTGGQDG